jgi:hypothetical protein
MTPWNGRMVASVSRPPVGLLSQWDGVSLTGIPGDSLGYGMQFGSSLYHLTTWGSQLVATGAFATNGSACVPDIAIYDGAMWSTTTVPWDATMRAPGVGVSALEAWNGKLVVAGTSVLIADQDHYMYVPDGNSVFDGTHWARLSPTPVGAQYKVLGKWKGDLILAGYTLAVVGTSIKTVARWDGVSWSGFGDDPPYFPYAIQEFHDDLYLANDSEDPATEGVARWNGTSWVGLGTGFPSGSVETLCVHGDSLVAGGLFSQAGGVAVNNIAFWDGTAWHPAGAGFDNVVDAVGSWNGVLVAGGRFSSSGGQPMAGAAYWDGTTWHQMGSNAVDVVYFEVEEGELFASGKFRLPDASVVTTVAHWTGSDWQLLGSGTNEYAFAIYNGYLYDAGEGIVHGHVSHGLSRMPLGGILSAPRPQTSAHIALAVSPNPARGRAAFSFTLPAAGHARVTVLDLAGRRVATLADGALQAGPHRADWATPGAPGVYLALLETSAGRVSRRFVVLGR